MGQKGLMFLEGDGSKCLNRILELLMFLKYMHYVYKYALQEDSLLKCFKSYFEKKTFHCTLFVFVGL